MLSDDDGAEHFDNDDNANDESGSDDANDDMHFLIVCAAPPMKHAILFEA